MVGANTDTINLPGHYTINAAESQGRGGKVAYDPQPHSDNFKFADNDDHPGKASHDDSKINDITNNHPLQQPADNSLHTPTQHDDNGSPAATDGAHPGRGQGDGSEPASPKFADDGSPQSAHATGEDTSVPSALADNGHHPIADPEINLASIAPNQPPEHPADNLPPTPAQHDDGPHPADPSVDVNEVPSFKFADEGSADSGHLAHPHFDNAKVPGTVMSDAASDQFVFEKGHDKVADVKPDMIETDHAVADIQHLLHTAHDANAVGALDPNHTTAPQDMTKVQLPHHHGDFHFA
jgi:hypothetical protein